jgi:hypothetical protein
VCLTLWKIVINIFINPSKIKATQNFVVYFLPIAEVRNIQELWEFCSDLTLSVKDMELLCQEFAFWELWRESFCLTSRLALG